MDAVAAPRRLVVLAPNWLGDAVMALPLLGDLRRAWPAAHITVAARGAVAPLFAMVSDVSETIVFEGGGGRRAFRTWRKDVRLLDEGRFDAALLLPNSFLAAWLVSRAGIPERWGFARDLRGPLLTRPMPRPSPHAHQAEYYQALALGLGVPIGDRFARVTPSNDDKAGATLLLREAGIVEGRRFAVFAPGAAYGRAKQWPPARFAELATRLDGESVVTVLVGAKGDLSACQEVSALATQRSGLGPHQVINLAGRTDLATLAGLLSLAETVVANDSGAMHLAAAVGARVVAVFGPTDNAKTSPLRAGAEAPAPRIVATDVWCRPCMLRECPIDHRCMTRVSARMVFDALH